MFHVGELGVSVHRLARHSSVSTALAQLSDRRLARLLDRAEVIGSGIGGTAVAVRLEGVPVFVKRVPLTDIERRPENLRSTANLFRLPMCCHYGVGSAGSGVWRELAAHLMTTGWVLGRRSESFPLLYHWRVVDGVQPSTPTEIDSMVEYWGGSLAVRERLEAIAAASASVALFCEYLPGTLHEWLTAQAAEGDEAIEAACAMVDRELWAGVRCMSSNGLLHFDAHFRNILTDGRRLYFADFGLATSPRFELSPAESQFVRDNASHDGCYVLTELVNWLVNALVGAVDRNARVELIRGYAEGERPAGVPASVASIIRRYAPVAVVMNDFYGKLYLESRSTPYPVEEVRRACAASAFDL